VPERRNWIFMSAAIRLLTYSASITVLMTANHHEDSEPGGKRETGVANQYCLVVDSFVLGVSGCEMA
jgi:hypothetical protein